MTRKYNTKHPERNKFKKYSYGNKLKGRQIKKNAEQRKRYESGGSQ